MPYSKPGRIKYRTNTATILTHNQPCRIGNTVGAAIKQRAVAFDAGIADQNKIQAGEQFAILAKGVVEHDTSVASASALAGAAIDAAVYITAGHVLATTNGGGANLPYGRVHEVIAQDRGVPAGRVRIDLDNKPPA